MFLLGRGGDGREPLLRGADPVGEVVDRLGKRDHVPALLFLDRHDARQKLVLLGLDLRQELEAPVLVELDLSELLQELLVGRHGFIVPQGVPAGDSVLRSPSLTGVTAPESIDVRISARARRMRSAESGGTA